MQSGEKSMAANFISLQNHLVRLLDAASLYLSLTPALRANYVTSWSKEFSIIINPTANNKWKRKRNGYQVYISISRSLFSISGFFFGRAIAKVKRPSWIRSGVCRMSGERGVGLHLRDRPVRQPVAQLFSLYSMQFFLILYFAMELAPKWIFIPNAVALTHNHIYRYTHADLLRTEWRALLGSHQAPLDAIRLDTTWLAGLDCSWGLSFFWDFLFCFCFVLSQFCQLAWHNRLPLHSCRHSQWALNCILLQQK